MGEEMRREEMDKNKEGRMGGGKCGNGNGDKRAENEINEEIGRKWEMSGIN
jgi:hypothetical protein